MCQLPNREGRHLDHLFGGAPSPCSEAAAKSQSGAFSQCSWHVRLMDGIRGEKTPICRCISVDCRWRQMFRSQQSGPIPTGDGANGCAGDSSDRSRFLPGAIGTNLGIDLPTRHVACHRCCRLWQSGLHKGCNCNVTF